MRPGEVVRFRMLNACSDNLMPIAVEGHEMNLIALDGINFGAPRTIPAYGPGGPEQVLLAPANRAEFLIKGNATPGIYKVLQRAQDAAIPRKRAEDDLRDRDRRRGRGHGPADERCRCRPAIIR